MSSPQSKGGKARAAALTAPERSAISRRAANARWKPQTATAALLAKPIHQPIGKRDFIRSFCNRLRDVAIERVPAMPNEWDGHELRLYLAQLFSDEVTLTGNSKRRAEYRKALMMNNL
jgi:hypothetical protein